MSEEKSGEQAPYRLGFLKATWLAVDGKPDKLIMMEIKRENIVDDRPEIYHYTNLSGLYGIINSKGLWVSDSRFMNDAEEIIHGYNLAASIIAFYAKKTAQREFRCILDEVRDTLLKRPQLGPFVACFSMVRDSLEQWRGYASENGVCIRFGHPKNNQRPLFFLPDTIPIRVIYKWRQKVTLILSIIKRFEREYGIDRKHFVDRWPPDHDDNYVKYLNMLLSHRIQSFKNEAFAQEAEIRMVLDRSYADRYYGGVKFRPSNFGLIPYFCTGNREGVSELLPLEEVIVGPSPHKELIAESVRGFLDHSGYQSTLVTLSSVPYRTP